MRPATKHWLFLILLVLSLLVMMALALWQMAKARREAVSLGDRPSSMLASAAPHGASLEPLRPRA